MDSMKDIAKIAAGFLSVAAVFVGVVYFLPDAWRIHPATIKPMILSKQEPDGEIDRDVMVVGDCTAWEAPYRYSKLAVARNTMTDKLLKRIAKSSANPKRVIIMYGMGCVIREKTQEEIDSAIVTVKEAVNRRFPDAEVFVIHPNEVLEIAATHNRGGGDIWHMNEDGYQILAKNHPEIFSEGDSNL